MPRLAVDEPIVAPATAAGAGERAVLRLSGAGLIETAAALLPPGCPLPRARREVRHGRLEWAPGAQVEVALLVFPGPASATGEDVLELHLPGSVPVVDAVLAGLRARGARLAEPGEFTRRAFLNGRLDLSQAEAVLELVEARSAAGAAAAARLLAGAAGRGLRAARDAVAAALTEIEAGLDFEEGDSQDLQPEEIEPLLAAAAAALAEGERLADSRRLRDGPPRIALLGAPNAGKSSLFRRLSGAPALIAAEPGTTRDRLEARWQAPGRDDAWLLCDGPGVGGTAVDPRDAAARRRAAAEAAELWWLVADASDPASAPLDPPAGAPALVVWTKCDRPRAVPERVVAAAAASGPMVWTSARDGRGLAELVALSGAELDRQVLALEARRGAGERHRAALASAAAAVARARALRAAAAPAELVAEELRAALRALGELLGQFTPEDLLDRLFARFCVGK